MKLREKVIGLLVTNKEHLPEIAEWSDMDLDIIEELSADLTKVSDLTIDEGENLAAVYDFFMSGYYRSIPSTSLGQDFEDLLKQTLVSTPNGALHSPSLRPERVLVAGYAQTLARIYDDIQADRFYKATLFHEYMDGRKRAEEEDRKDK